jgi:hypothetical protein
VLTLLVALFVSCVLLFRKLWVHWSVLSSRNEPTIAPFEPRPPNLRLSAERPQKMPESRMQVATIHSNTNIAAPSHPNDGVFVRCAPMRKYPLGSSFDLVVFPLSDQTRMLPSAQGSILKSCLNFQTLQSHSQFSLARLSEPFEREHIQRFLAASAASGFLISLDEIRSRCAQFAMGFSFLSDDDAIQFAAFLEGIVLKRDHQRNSR